MPPHVPFTHCSRATHVPLMPLGRRPVLPVTHVCENAQDAAHTGRSHNMNRLRLGQVCHEEPRLHRLGHAVMPTSHYRVPTSTTPPPERPRGGRSRHPLPGRMEPSRNHTTRTPETDRLACTREQTRRMAITRRGHLRHPSARRNGARHRMQAPGHHQHRTPHIGPQHRSSNLLHVRHASSQDTRHTHPT